ncbi:helix-hairpin-helix domain-containing protein [Methylibium sp.]|uniref:ComEA family DNA-binding protein n=1 Tax=Methylibium sp. TaxID=2067992 RepID=UPI00286ADAD5|nr:helix-hairpin-helix domain-containing protein [Methylibium sp.]
MKRARLLVVPLLLAVASIAAALEVNTASQAELESLKGVGTVLSAKLIKARSVQAFTDWSDLMKRVPGVRTATAARLSAGGLTVAGAPYADAAAAAAAVAGKAAASAGAATPR